MVMGNSQPSNNPRFNDDTGQEQRTVVVNGHLEVVVTTIPIHWVLRISGYFDQDGFNVTSVIGNGPSQAMSSPDGSITGAKLEPGDIITQVELAPVPTANAYAIQMNGAPNHAQTRITVWDQHTGQEFDWFVAPIHKP